MSPRRIATAVLLLVCVLALAVPPVGYAWRNGAPDDRDGYGTHDWVLAEADRLARESGVTWLDTAAAMRATDDPDSVYNDRYHHNYDVWGESRTGDGPTWIAGVFRLAVRQRATGDTAGASVTVGLLAHYYSDLCNPLHTDDWSAENGLHGAYELDAQLRTDKPGENRSWIVPDGVRPETDPAARAAAAATIAHGSYAALIDGYGAHGFDADVEAITRASLDRAVNGLADIIAGVDASAEGTAPVDRLAGASRYETAVEISRRSFPATASAVVVATGEDWPDGLAGAPLAASYDAPLLLVRNDTVPAAVGEEIERLRPGLVIVLGGPSAVSEDVERALSAIAPVERLGGVDRYGTARTIAERVRSRTPTWTGGVFVATGLDFPDALAASPVAASRRMPILLTRRDALPADTVAAVRAIGVRKAYVLGSERAVGASAASALGGLCAAPPTRLSGADRYATARAVAETAQTQWGASTARPALTTGERFPDALTGGVALGRAGRIMLLTRSDRLSVPATSFLQAHRDSITGLSVLGGESAVSSGVVRAALRAAAGLPPY